MQRTECRETKVPAQQDSRAAFVLRVLMERRGYTAQGLVDAMLIEGIDNIPSRATVDRILRDGAVPQRRYKASLAAFFGKDTDEIWLIAGSRKVAA